MEHIWAPWRSVYIKGKEPVDEGCVLCAHFAAPQSEHRDRGVLFKNEYGYVVLNRFPYTGGHVMVVPHRHAPTPLDLSDEEYAALSSLLRSSIQKVQQAFKPDGINVGMNLGRPAGAGIDQHCHFHIVPRWNGDTNFMSVVSDMRVVSQSLLETYDVLKPCFEKP